MVNETGMKKTVSIVLTISVLAFLYESNLFAQAKESSNAESKLYVSTSGNFNLHYNGILQNSRNGECTIRLPDQTGKPPDHAYVHVFVDSKPFVYLPGTFGGKYFFMDGRNDKAMSNRVAGDSLSVNGLAFARDYWAVYGGHGQWETVINCYAYQNGKYYVISLEHDVMTPLPGEKANGSRATKTQMRNELIDGMRDGTSPYVSDFNNILRSFSLTK